MPIKITTGQIDIRKVQGVEAALRAVVTPEFVEAGMDIERMGSETLAYLKKIFPKSPPDAPRRGNRPLVEGWTVFRHPSRSFSRNPGFTVRRKNSSLRDHQIIASLDQGSRAYTRIIPIGVRTSFLKTRYNPLYSAQEVGKPVFLTGTGLIFNFRQRQGLHFMDKTYEFALGLLNTARQRYYRAARRRIVSGGR
jgi:hypothetical protein